jgi:inorganic pyrophosphatase
MAVAGVALAAGNATAAAAMSGAAVNATIPIVSVIGLLFALWLYRMVASVRVAARPDGAGGAGVYSLLQSEAGVGDSVEASAAQIQEAIVAGSRAFLFTEYRYMAVFMGAFGSLLFVLLASADGFRAKPSPDFDGVPALANAAFTTVAFLLGASTSIVSGYLGMEIAVFANARTALEARRGVGHGFLVAFRAGAVMGFALTSLGLLVLWITILAFSRYFGDDYRSLFEAIAGYGLGGSSIALFGRVGGGIYTKAADVGADLVGKVEKDIPEDDPRNPATIADNVGDNVGDIAGMGADLFGSFAESTCAALVVSSVSSFGEQQMWAPMLFPLLISAGGIVVCFLTHFAATTFARCDSIPQIEPTLKAQLVISTVLMTPVAFALSWFALPSEPFEINGADHPVHRVGVFLCVAAGLWSGLAIGLMTEYFTSNRFTPVKEVAESCKTGAATNVIFGLALGYKSCVVPVTFLALTIYMSHQLAATYGVACAALGMLGTLATGLTIDGYGPISDNAGGIAEMAGMGEEIRERTDALDAAGNTTAAIGKGFAIGSAALVSLALFGAFTVNAGVESVDILNPKEFAGLIFGAMLPYWFSAMTMKSVGKAALAMVEEVRRQFRENPGLMDGSVKPDYQRCVAISTKSSLEEMIAPGALVLLTPIIVGLLFGNEVLAGTLAGSLVSGVQVAISASNTGGAWDNAKKYLEAGATEHARLIGGKGTDAHKAAVIGDTVGDPLKDTSGPAINILLKLCAIESVVLAPFFHQQGALLFKLFGAA